MNLEIYNLCLENNKGVLKLTDKTLCKRLLESEEAQKA